MRKAIQRGDGKWNCLTKVYEKTGYGLHLCSKHATQDPDADGNPTKCSVHSEAGQERLAQRRRERDAKLFREWTEKEELRQLAEQRKAAMAAAIEACRKIAAGHNDPRALAQEVIAMLPEAPDE